MGTGHLLVPLLLSTLGPPQAEDGGHPRQRICFNRDNVKQLIISAQERKKHTVSSCLLLGYTPFPSGRCLCAESCSWPWCGAARSEPDWSHLAPRSRRRWRTQAHICTQVSALLKTHALQCETTYTSYTDLHSVFMLVFAVTVPLLPVTVPPPPPVRSLSLSGAAVD